MFMHNFGGWWFPGAGILMALVCIGFIVLVVWGVSRLARHGSYHSMIATKQNPIDIAKERYAKGEITKEQFDQIKKDLS